MTIELFDFLEEQIKPYLSDFSMNLLVKHIELEVRQTIIDHELQKIRESKAGEIQ